MKVRLRKLRWYTCALARRPSTLAHLLRIQRTTGQHSHGNVQGYLDAYTSYLIAEDLPRQMSRPGFARRMFDPGSLAAWERTYKPEPFLYTQEDADKDRREAALRKAQEKASGKLSVKSLIDASFL